jgi:hypothetical protein
MLPLSCSTKLQAEAYCSNMGARLCTITELLTGETAGSGVCEHDSCASNGAVNCAAHHTHTLSLVQLRSVPRLE